MIDRSSADCAFLALLALVILLPWGLRPGPTAGRSVALQEITEPAPATITPTPSPADGEIYLPTLPPPGPAPAYLPAIIVDRCTQPAGCVRHVTSTSEDLP